MRTGPFRLRGIEGEFRVAEHQDVAALEFRFGNPLAVDEGSVRAVEIIDGIDPALAVDHGVPPRDPP